MSDIKADLINSVSAAGTMPKDVLAGVHLTVVESKHLGITSTLVKHGQNGDEIEGCGNLTNLALVELMDMLHSENWLKASLGMAALKSVMDINHDWQHGNAWQIIKKSASNQNVSIIGHFNFVDRLRPLARNCWVFELNPGYGDLPADKINEYLPQSDLLIITAQTIINGTFYNIVKNAGHAHKIVLGPSCPPSTVLFDYGVDVIGSAKIKDAQLVKQFVKQGARFKQIEGVELVTLSKNRNTF